MQDPRSQLIKELAKDCKSVADIQERLKSCSNPFCRKLWRPRWKSTSAIPSTAPKGTIPVTAETAIAAKLSSPVLVRRGFGSPETATESSSQTSSRSGTGTSVISRTR